MDSFNCVAKGLGCSSQVSTCWEDVVVSLIGQLTHDRFLGFSENLYSFWVKTHHCTLQLLCSGLAHSLHFQGESY